MADLEGLARATARVVTAAELDAGGIDRNGVARLRRAGRLVRMFHGVYAVPPTDEPAFALACRAATRYAGAGACVVGESALALRSAYPAPAAPEVGVPRERSVRSTPGLRVVHLAPAAFTGSRRLDGVDVQQPARAVAYAWSRLASLDDRRAALCAAVACGAATTSAVRGALASLPRLRGRTALAAACDHVDLGCRSPAEMEYLLRVERAYGLPPGTRQARIDVPGGRIRLVDVLYGRLVVEIDGLHHRLDETTRHDDAVRDVVLAALGYRILRVDAADIRRDPALVAARIRESLASAA